MGNEQTKVINMKSEILYRSAEDDFYHFRKISSAIKKLKRAVELTPNHLKSLVLLADTTFIKGNTKKALEIYRKAEEINGSNVKVTAAIANCCNALGMYNEALIYCNKALAKFNAQSYGLFSQIFEIKINIYIAQKQYEAAYSTWKTAKNMYNDSFLQALYNVNYEILNEKINIMKKLQKSNLKIV